MTGEGEPHYQNELSIYEEETLKKIEDFRRARSNFGMQRNINQTIYTNIKKDLGDSHIYKGRCMCLRKLRLKTTFLLYHFKTLKPLRYYTLKKKVTDYDKLDYEIESKEHEEEDITLRTLEDTCTTRQLWTREAVEECFTDAYNTKGRRDRAEKKKECMRKKPSGPCREVMRKLKAGSFKGGIIESCKCEDGREVTVVIKGICLCDKSNLNNINLNRVCDEYSKMVNKVPEAEFPSVMKPQETLAEPLDQQAVVRNYEQKNEPDDNISYLENQGDNIKAEKGVGDLKDNNKSTEGTNTKDKNWDEIKSSQKTDHLKANKKRKGANSLADDQKQASRQKITSKKKISFKPSDLKPESTNRSKPNASELTVYPKSVSEETVEGLPQVMGDFKASDSLRNFFTESDHKQKTIKNAKQGVDSKSGDTEPTENSDKPTDDLKESRKSWQKDSSEIYRKKLQRDHMRKIIDEKKEVDSPKDKAKEGVDNKSNDKESTKHAETKSESPDPKVPRGPGAFLREDSLYFHRKKLGRTSDENIDGKKKEINMPESKSKISATLSQNKSEIKSADELKAGNEKSSMISLYRNVPEEMSNMALTKEELEKLEKTKFLVTEKTQ